MNQGINPWFAQKKVGNFLHFFEWKYFSQAND